MTKYKKLTIFTEMKNGTCLRNESIKTTEDLLQTLDLMFSDEKKRWEGFFKNLKNDHPLATQLPDEHLVEFLSQNPAQPGRALDVGCGNGRNAVYLNQNGYQVDAFDISEEAVSTAKAHADASNAQVNFSVRSFLSFTRPSEPYDLIYDLGCLHHIHPHRRPQYMNFVMENLAQGGFFILGCFNEKMGTSKTDLEILQQRDMEGGLNFSTTRLKDLFGGSLELIKMRDMKAENSPETGVGWEHMRISIWKKA